ncbi:MAG: hypothetical protein AAGG38_11595 [Planctomycetota bacterium]
MDWKLLLQNDPRFGGMYQRVAGRPSWPMRAALLCGGLVAAVPVVLALLGALVGVVVGVAVYTAGTAIARWTGQTVNTRPSGDDAAMRENVRVVRRP